MAKYAFPDPFDYYCKKCDTKFYETDLIKPSLFLMRLNLGKGSCPGCKRAHDVFTIEKESKKDWFDNEHIS